MMHKETSLSENQFHIAAQPQKTLLEVLAERGIFMEGGCDGKGRCGRCMVRYLSAAPLPTASERKFLTAQKLRDGFRLACLHRADRECVAEVCFTQAARVDIVTDSLWQEKAREDVKGEAETSDWKESDWCIAIDLGTTTIAMQARSLYDGKVLAQWKEMNPQRRFGSDVISRMQAALDGRSEVLQKSVMAVLAEGIQELKQAVARQSAGAGRDDAPENAATAPEGSATAPEGSATAPESSATAPGSLATAPENAATAPESSAIAWEQEPAGIYLAGNTVMEHLLAGLSVEGLSRHPFVPVTLDEFQIKLQDIAYNDRTEPAANRYQTCPCRGHAPSAYSVTLLPGLSAFVGADLLAGVLACNMHRREKISLLIDLGTNGEIVLGNKEKLMCTATAAGPAFEGGPGSAAPGTDMIAVIAELLDAGVADETGLMAEPWFEEGIDWTPGKGEVKSSAAAGEKTAEKSGTAADTRKIPGRPVIHMTQAEIRAVQMAKAAIYAGICVLTREYGITFAQIETVFLAGGFGYYLDVAKAARIGLFPAELTDRVEAVGNTSLAGAFLYGRNSGQKDGERIQEICRAINLAGQPEFEEIYLSHLNF